MINNQKNFEFTFKEEHFKPYYRNLDMQINTDIDNTLQEYINNNFEKIKSVEVTDNEITKEEFFGDIMDPINTKERDQYVQLMNTFLSRKDKRKLSRYKGFKSFTDRMYGK